MSDPTPPTDIERLEVAERELREGLACEIMRFARCVDATSNPNGCRITFGIGLAHSYIVHALNCPNRDIEESAPRIQEIATAVAAWAAKREAGRRERECHHGWRGSVPEGGKYIVDRCPSCMGKHLFVGNGGYLTCANLTSCNEPSVGVMIDQLRDQLAESRAEVKAAMAVLTPSMPESGLVDACRQVKQAAISWRDNRAAVDAENAALREELELLRQELSMRLPIPMAGEKWWSCLIGPAHPDELPGGADAPMREAVGKAFKILTGTDDLALFSGWGDHPNEPQRAVIANTTISETRALAALDFWRAGRMG